MKLSISEENHIKGIYHLQQDDSVATTNALAAHLQTKAASVTDMLKKLTSKKLLHYERYRGFTLTEKGSRMALGIIRRHRLWEYFLADKLGFEWDKVHAIAEELEHVSSDELVLRLGNYLGNPTTDPHGDPIPDAEGRMPQVKQMNLLEIPLHKSVMVSAVGNHDPEMLEMLTHYGIAIGTKLKIKKQFAFDGSLELIINHQTCTISGQVAKNIFVRYGN